MSGCGSGGWTTVRWVSAVHVEPDTLTSGEFVRALDRGIALLCAFSDEVPTLTVAEAAAATGLTRGTARRLLHTLVTMGYVSLNGRDYGLTPKVLRIGYGYLSSKSVGILARPYIQSLARSIHASVTVAALDDLDYVVLARADGDVVMTTRVTIGTRRPAHVSSLGKVLLAALDPDELHSRLDGIELSRWTERSITDHALLREELERIRTQGWAISDQEIENGLISIGVPLVDRNSHVVAALNTANHVGRTSIKEMKETVLPQMIETARQISEHLAYH